MSFADKIRAAITRRLATADDRALRDEQWEADMRAAGWMKVPDRASNVLAEDADNLWQDQAGEPYDALEVARAEARGMTAEERAMPFEQYVNEREYAEAAGITVEEYRARVDDELAEVENPEAAFERYMEEAAEQSDRERMQEARGADTDSELQADIREAIEEGLLVGRSATKITQDVMAEVRHHRARQVEDGAEVTTEAAHVEALAENEARDAADEAWNMHTYHSDRAADLDDQEDEAVGDYRQHEADLDKLDEESDFSQWTSEAGEAEAVRQFEEQDARRREAGMRYFDNRDAELAAEAKAYAEAMRKDRTTTTEDLLNEVEEDAEDRRRWADEEAKAEAAQERFIDQGEAAVEEVLDAEDRDVSNPRNALGREEDLPASTYYDAEFFDPGYLAEAYEENALTEGVAYQNAKSRGLPHGEASAYQRLEDAGDTTADGWGWHAQGGWRNDAGRQEAERQAPKARSRPSVDTGSDDYYYGNNASGHGFAL